MADKKKMTVAEMLAAARKADGGGAPAGEPAAVEPAPPVEEGAAESAPATPASGEKPKSIPKPGAAGRPSVAEMMAMARAGKAGGAAPAPKAAGAKPSAAEKPKPAPKAKPVAAEVAAAASEPRDTASILAAARKKDKPGPMSKAEAAAKASPAAPAKPKVVAPPMPVKPDYAKPAAPAKAPAAKGGAGEDRRDFFSTAMAVGFWSLGAVSALWTLLTVKFMFPNVLREPPSKFKVGFPDAFPPGQVDENFKAEFAVWIVNAEYNGQQQIVALKSVCTHLGCTPNWLEAEQKYKCPCHGSGFYKDGINFEGPAPRPLERYAIRMADDGQIEVDKTRTFQEEMGAWSDPASFILV
jgi:cytochrome b6-f complex iron-sulfur subunit